MKTYLTYPYISWNVNHFTGKSSICKVPSIGWNRMIAMWFSQLNGIYIYIYLLVKDHNEKVTCKLRTAKRYLHLQIFQAQLSHVFSWKLFRIEHRRDLGCLALPLQKSQRIQFRQGVPSHDVQVPLSSCCSHLTSLTCTSSQSKVDQRWKRFACFLSPSKCKGGTGIQLGDGCTFCFPSQGAFSKNSLHQAEIRIIFHGKIEHLATSCSLGINEKMSIFLIV